MNRAVAVLRNVQYGEVIFERFRADTAPSSRDEVASFDSWMDKPSPEELLERVDVDVIDAVRLCVPDVVAPTAGREYCDELADMVALLTDAFEWLDSERALAWNDLLAESSPSGSSPSGLVDPLPESLFLCAVVRSTDKLRSRSGLTSMTRIKTLSM